MIDSDETTLICDLQNFLLENYDTSLVYDVNKSQYDLIVRANNKNYQGLDKAYTFLL